jgi:phosphatidylglycerophosphate synthase
MRAVLRAAGEAPALGWKSLLFDARVGGLSLLNRHLLGLRNAGIEHVTLVLPADTLDQIAPSAARCVPPGVSLSVVSAEQFAGHTGVSEEHLLLEQRADTLVDPRLIAQVARLTGRQPCNIVCVDVDGPNTAKSKSPYVVGVPEADEARPVERAGLVPVGLAVDAGAGASTVHLHVGRYFWHRFTARDDVRIATTKVLLATMKATDGAFAQTNRRVSLRISRLLLNTGVTANMVTVATLGCGLLAGWLMSRGHYAAFVAGSLMAWFASMLDGVDGELARAKFQASPFGHWLEMACDYVFYVALFVGLGAGFHRVTGHARWLVLGVGSGIGAILSFAAVAHLKRSYARRGAIGDFYLAYERAVTTPDRNLFMRVTPHLTAFFTRAVFPYFLVLFALLGILKVALVLMFVSTQGFWMVALVLSRGRARPGTSAHAGVAQVDS